MKMVQYPALYLPVACVLAYFPLSSTWEDPPSLVPSDPSLLQADIRFLPYVRHFDLLGAVVVLPLRLQREIRTSIYGRH